MSIGHRLSLSLLPLVLAAAPAAASLRAYWSFDGCSTTELVAGPNLTAGSGPSCVTGPIGTGWSLDGSTQYLERGNDARFVPGSGAFSVAVWAKRAFPKPATDTIGVIVSWYRCGANPGCTSITSGLWPLWDLNGRAAWDVRDDAVTDVTLTDSTVNVSGGQWHLFVGTLNAAHTLSSLYVDGTLRKSQVTALTSVTGFPPLEVGRWYRTGWAAPGYYYTGSVAELRLYDEELTAGAVAALYAARTAVAPGAPSASLALERIAPNPVRGSNVRVEFSLAGDAPARVELLDLPCRRLAEERLAGVSAGRHAVTFDGHGAFPPGVYLARVSQGAATASWRVTLLL